MKKVTWKIYNETEINPNYMGEDILIVSKTNNGGFKLDRDSYDNSCGVRMMRGSGVIFRKVFYLKAWNFLFNGNAPDLYSEAIKRLEEMLLIKKERASTSRNPSERKRKTRS